MIAPLLEVIVTSVADAIEAESGGATRLEVVRELDRGGLTPPLQLVRDIMAAVKVPVRVMVRESDGFGISGPDERDRLRRAARELSTSGIDGLVLGFMRGRSLALAATTDVLACAPELKATFHHAFDEVADREAALGALKACRRIDWVLTRGSEGPAEDRATGLWTLANAASPEIAVMVGGGVDVAVIRALRGKVDVRAFHVGRAARAPAAAGGRVSAAKVRALWDLLQIETSRA